MPQTTPLATTLLHRLLAHAEHLVENAGGGEKFFAEAIAIAEQAIADPGTTGERLVRAAIRVMEFIDKGYSVEQERLKTERDELTKTMH